MELFREDGHITPEGLRALADGALDELGRLEAAEHFSFCDACLLEYTLLLDSRPLTEPAQPLKPGINRRIRRRGAKLLLSRYATVAAAACIAVGLWNAVNHVAFSPGDNTPQTSPGITSGFGSFMQSMADRGRDFSNSLSSGLGNLFSSFAPSPGAPVEQPTQSPDRQQENPLPPMFLDEAENKPSSGDDEGKGETKADAAQTPAATTAPDTAQPKDKDKESHFVTADKREELFNRNRATGDAADGQKDNSPLPGNDSSQDDPT